MQMLKDYLMDRGTDVKVVYEPGGTWVGDRIRDILLNSEQVDIDPLTEALLFAADRAQQVKELVKPSLEKGWIVLSDRYIDSSLAYQGVARGCGLEAVQNLNQWATGRLEPDLTIFLDLPVEKGLARTAGYRDRIEQESVEFHHNVRHAYDMLIRIYPNRIVTVDATGSPEDVHTRVVQIVERTL